MKARRIGVLIFCLVVLFSTGYVSANWAPGNTTIHNNIADNKSSSFFLSMDNPIKWEVGHKTLLSMNTFGGWDVGYNYHFNWNFGEGIDVASDGWSYPELMTRAELDIGARAWLKLIGPGVTLDFWTIDPFNVDILKLLGVNSKIEEAISIPDIQFSLPFLEDNNPLVECPFKSGIYDGDYSQTTFFNLAKLAQIPAGITGNIGVARGLQGSIAFGLKSIDYYSGSNKIGSQSSAYGGVDVSNQAGNELTVNKRDYIFKVDPRVGAGVALYAELGVWEWSITTYYPEEGSTPPDLINAKITTSFDMPPISLEKTVNYSVPGAGSNPIEKDTGGGGESLTVTADVLEENNNTANATLVGSFPYSRNNLSIHNSSDIDYFEINTNNTGRGTITIDLNFQNAIGDLDMYLYGPSGDIVAKSTSPTDNEHIGYNLAENGKYYVKIKSRNNSLNNYDLSINFISSELPPNGSPALSNQHVTPYYGTASTSFEYLVDYNDPDGDPPGYSKNVYIDGNGPYAMNLKSGISSNGTYSYQTQLSNGTHNYFFSFIENNGGVVVSPIYTGPNVYTSNSTVEIKVEVDGGPITNNIEVQFGYGPDLANLEYQEWFAPELPKTLGIDSGQQLMFQVNTDSENHTYKKWVFRDDNGNVVRESTGSGYGFTLLSGNLHATAYISYTPINYAISGTILRQDGTPVPGNVELTLTSSEQALTTTTANGNFSFAGVKGGVSVTITLLANGYAFTPSKLVYNNLEDNHTGETIVSYALDSNAPMASIVTFPTTVSTESSVSFSWIGQDDVTLSENLLYQYKLDGVDLDWSSWGSITTKSYDLSNGSYTFWVRAKDEAENINQAPISYTFVVNAAPIVIFTERIKYSVWASRITLEMPTDATNPSNTFILLPSHSGIADSELVPVQIHRADEIAAIGANEIIAGELGLTTRIVKTDIGWLITLPENIPPGQTAQFDIVWGKIKYFGWQEFVSVPAGFPNGGIIDASYLDDDLKLWRTSAKRDDKGNGVSCDNDYWLFMNKSDLNGIILEENVLRFTPGECWGEGITGTYTNYSGSKIYGTDSNNIIISWVDHKYEYDGSDSYNYERYGFQLFDKNGIVLDSKEGIYHNKADIEFPKYLLNDSIWITACQDNRTICWFLVLDAYGNAKIERTNFDTVQDDYINPWSARSIGNNVFFLWEHYWEVGDGYRRREIVYQVHDNAGNIIKNKTIIAGSILDNSVEKNDEYTIENVITDNDGKVWISYQHYQSGEGSQWFYVIIGPDGNVWKGPIEAQGLREFRFCDKDGYIWTTESGQFYLLNSDDTIAVPARISTWIPNQKVREVAARVSSTGYRLYDRWSSQHILINVPEGVYPASMEMYDLNLWGNNLHPANITLKKGDALVWNQNGELTGHITVDMSGKLTEGPNVLTMNQDDFLGGQVLFTFPYVISPSHNISGEIKLYGETGDITDIILVLSGSDIQITHPESSGAFSYTELEQGNYKVTPYLTDYHFFPASLSYSTLDNDEFNQNIIGLHETYDSEPDNLTDWWEQQIINADPDDAITNVEGVLPGGDFDRDGFTNLLEYLAGTNPTDENSKPIIKGDINADGSIDLADAIIALKVSVGISVGYVYLDRDLNGDGRIGLKEAIYAVQKVSKLR